MNSRGEAFLGWAAGSEELVVRSWAGPPSAVHPVCSEYTEKFWLPVLGPTSMVLARNLARRFGGPGECLAVRCDTLAAELGLGAGMGRNAPLMRTLARMVSFGVAGDGAGHLMVALTWPPLPANLRRRLPESLRSELAAFGAPSAAHRPTGRDDTRVDVGADA